ncbi:MAG: hypothetical protein Q8P67_07185, partial [archaeon]|nr:hypothetical protein [archaeon]
SDEDEILFDEDTIPGEEFSVEEVGTETARRMGMQVEDWTNVDDLSLDDIWEKEAPQMEDIHSGFNAAGEIVDPVLAFKTVMATIGSPDD